MPGILYQPVNRRRFLNLSAQACAGVVASGILRISAADTPGPAKPVRFALLSDTHIAADPKDEYRKFLPSENLKSIVPQVIESRPEGVIINGDAARLTGELADYGALKSLLAPLTENVPIYIGLGNHDNRENFLMGIQPQTELRQTVPDKYVLVIEKGGLRFILLDSLLYVNKVAGLLGKVQRKWLADYLESSDSRPTVLFVHHTLGDGDGDLLDIERLYSAIRPHRKVKAIFYGHSHEYAFAEREGVHLVNLPAVGYNFKDTEPVGWVAGSFTSEGVDLTLRALAGDRTADGKTTTLTWKG